MKIGDLHALVCSLRGVRLLESILFRFVIPVLLLQAFSFSIYAQDEHKIDSLTSALKIVDDQEKVKILFLLCSEYYDIDNNKAFEYIEQAFRLASKGSDSAQFVTTGRVKGQLLRRLSRIKESIELLGVLEPIAKRNEYNDDYKKILNALSIAFTYQAEYDKALRYNLKSLSVREKEGNKAEMSIAYNNLGVLYVDLGIYGKGLEYFNKSLKLKNEIGDRFDLARLLINIGIALREQHNYEQAEKYIQAGLKECGGKDCKKNLLIEGYSALGSIYHLRQELVEAKRFFLNSYKLAAESGDKRFQAQDLLGLIQIAIEQDDLKEAANLVVTGEKMADEFLQIKLQIYAEHAKLSEKLGYFPQAYRYQRKYQLLQDSVYNSTLTRNLMLAETEYEQHNNNIKIEAQNEIIELNSALLSRQQTILIMGLIAVLLLIIIVTILFGRNRQRKLANAKLEERVKERTKELEGSYHSLLKTSEERDYSLARVARGLKDPLLSLQGINTVARREVTDLRALDYFQRTDVIISQLLDIVNRFGIGNDKESKV